MRLGQSQDFSDKAFMNSFILIWFKISRYDATTYHNMTFCLPCFTDYLPQWWLSDSV